MSMLISQEKHAELIRQNGDAGLIGDETTRRYPVFDAASFKTELEEALRFATFSSRPEPRRGQIHNMLGNITTPKPCSSFVPHA